MGGTSLEQFSNNISRGKMFSCCKKELNLFKALEGKTVHVKKNLMTQESSSINSFLKTQPSKYAFKTSCPEIESDLHIHEISYMFLCRRCYKHRGGTEPVKRQVKDTISKPAKND